MQGQHHLAVRVVVVVRAELRLLVVRRKLLELLKLHLWRLLIVVSLRREVRAVGGLLLIKLLLLLHLRLLATIQLRGHLLLILVESGEHVLLLREVLQRLLLLQLVREVTARPTTIVQGKLILLDLVPVVVIGRE